MAIITNTGKGKRTFRFPIAEGLPDLAPGSHDVSSQVLARMRELLDIDAWIALGELEVIDDSPPAEEPAEGAPTRPGKRRG